MFIHCMVIICIIHHTVICVNESRQWKKLADNDIHQALEYKRNENVAKNIILFVGDGMDLNTVTAARIHSDGEDKYLSFERFQNIGLLKTYSANKLVPDSCSTATALFSGVKVNHKTGGVSPKVQHGDCKGSKVPENQLKTIMDWAQEDGKYTGFVTTTRVTHATPSALYAHTADRNWECEAKMPSTATDCKDIARQLIEDVPGKNINVIFGGGKQCLVSDVMQEKTNPIDNWACYSKDGRNLIHEWEKDKQQRDAIYAFVQNRHELLNVDTEMSEFVLGIFSNSHMYMCNENGTLHVSHRRIDQPSLHEMTEIAIKTLQKNDKGYLLVPLISAEGKLMSPVFLVLKEQGGKFGPVVEANLFRAVNVYVTASKSEKLTSDHFKIWLEEVYFPNVGKTSALLLDAWSGHCPKILEEAIPPNKNIILKKIPMGTTGYIQPLDVEGGLIDYAHHRGRARAALEETAHFSDAIQVALELTREEADHTLIIVTSDHSHSLLFSGYPNRGEGVLGIAQPSKYDGIPYTTLMYGTAGPDSYQYEVINGTSRRRDPSQDNTTSYHYSQQTGVVTDETTHGGSDVVVYARGPMAHLFNSVHEQTYVAYVIAYASKMGPYRDRDLTNYSENIAIPKYYIYTIISTLFTTFVSTIILFTI